MKDYTALPGINIQWPWSRLLLEGSKVIETRGYPIPEKFMGKPLAIIETPGPKGAQNGVTKAKVVGVIVFSRCFLYRTKDEWVRDQKKHRVQPDDVQFAFNKKAEKWGWQVHSVERLVTPQPAPQKRGRVYSAPFRVKLNG